MADKEVPQPQVGQKRPLDTLERTDSAAAADSNPPPTTTTTTKQTTPTAATTTTSTPATDENSDEDALPEEMLADGGGSSMDEAEYKRHCDALTISANRGSKRRKHDIRGCRSRDEFEFLNNINEGAYGSVGRWKRKAGVQGGGRVYALKHVKMEKEKEGFPSTALREINLLMTLEHPNIVNVQEIVTEATDGVHIVMEYVEHDLKFLMENMKHRWSIAAVKSLIHQLLSACRYMHDHWVIHRDLKTSNLLYNNKGQLKVCDFGLARLYGSPISPMSPGVVTLWYRAPEVLFGATIYTPAIDLWSVGCIFAELLQQEALCPGKGEQVQVGLIMREVGSPTEETWPGWEKLPGVSKLVIKPQPPGRLRVRFHAPGTPPTEDSRAVLSDSGYDLLSSLLTLNPDRRATAEVALQHHFLTDEQPLPLDEDKMPRFAATNEVDRKREKELRRKKQQEEEEREKQQQQQHPPQPPPPPEDPQPPEADKPVVAAP